MGESEGLIRNLLLAELRAEGLVEVVDGRFIWTGRTQDYTVDVVVRPTTTIRLSEN